MNNSAWGALFVIGVALITSICVVGFFNGQKKAGAGMRAKKADTVWVRDTIYIQEVPIGPSVLVFQGITCDSIKTALYVAQYKLERLIYYCKIVERNPSQQKFLKGWRLRATR